MKKIIVSNYVTLDGFFAGPQGEIDWFVWNEETVEYSKELLQAIDTILFGRMTYELMAGYWPTAAAAEEDPAIIEAMNNLPKIVFSRTLEKVGWNNAKLAKGDLGEEVTALKRRPGRDIVIYGSGSIVAALAERGLIDEYLLFVNPVVLGEGKPLFKGLKERFPLELKKTQVFKNGVVLLDYQLAKTGKPERQV
jgi:dihydrofolate reductase